MPSQPDISKVVATEICDARPGTYLVSVTEHGVDYRLSVSADDGSWSNKGNVTEPVTLHADPNRLCHYRFDLEMGDSAISVRWIDKDVHPLDFAVPPTCDAVPSP